MLDLKKIDNSWTLFLDRDGVINEEKHMDYVYNYTEFKFYPGTLEALKKLSGIFGRLIIVTNQRGVEKKLMTEISLLELHKKMQREIEANGGKIDAIFYCTSLDDNHPNRKPQPGMAYLAKERYPEIEFSKSVIVGNKLSDMFFGRNAGLFTVYVKTTHPDIMLPNPAIDLIYDNLADFSNELQSKLTLNTT
ncbi:MAG: HAD-IIIA family hydrolase [Chitinophagaceae bacterium]